MPPRPPIEGPGFEVEAMSPRDDAAVQGRAGGRRRPGVGPFTAVHVPRPRDGGDRPRASVLCDKPFGRTPTRRSRCGTAGPRRRLLTSATSSSAGRNRGRRSSSSAADSGAIGKPDTLELDVLRQRTARPPIRRINDRELGGGWIGAYGSHVIDFTRWLFDSEVTACGGVTRIEDPDMRSRRHVTQATAEDANFAGS